MKPSKQPVAMSVPRELPASTCEAIAPTPHCSVCVCLWSFVLFCKEAPDLIRMCICRLHAVAREMVLVFRVI